MKLKLVKSLSWMAAAGVLAAPLITLPGVANMFMSIPEISGEATDNAHKGEIDVLSWSWGCSNSGTTHDGSTSGSNGKASFDDLSMTKWVDKSSPFLMLYCANGKHLNDATLTVRKAGKDPATSTTDMDYLIIEMKNILVTSVSTGGSGGEDRLTENVTLNFSNVKVTYKEQDSKGSTLSTTTFEWDIPTATGG